MGKTPRNGVKQEQRHLCVAIHGARELDICTSDPKVQAPGGQGRESLYTSALPYQLLPEGGPTGRGADREAELLDRTRQAL